MNCREHYLYAGAFDTWGAYRFDKILSLSVAGLVAYHIQAAWGEHMLHEIAARRRDLWL